jgi:excisionase family DNA binding protein
LALFYKPVALFPFRDTLFFDSRHWLKIFRKSLEGISQEVIMIGIRKLYSEKEAAVVLNLSYGYLKELRRRKQISCVRFGRAVRYTDGNLEEFIKSRQQALAA